MTRRPSWSSCRIPWPAGGPKQWFHDTATRDAPVAIEATGAVPAACSSPSAPAFRPRRTHLHFVHQPQPKLAVLEEHPCPVSCRGVHRAYRDGLLALSKGDNRGRGQLAACVVGSDFGGNGMGSGGRGLKLAGVWKAISRHLCHQEWPTEGCVNAPAVSAKHLVEPPSGRGHRRIGGLSRLPGQRSTGIDQSTGTGKCSSSHAAMPTSNAYTTFRYPGDAPPSPPVNGQGTSSTRPAKLLAAA